MPYTLIILAISILVNVGGGWALKHAWQEQAAIEAEAREKYAALSNDYTEDTEALEGKLNQARNRYGELVNENYRQQQLLVEKDKAVDAMRREMRDSLGRMNAIVEQSDEDLQACLNRRLPDDYARELFGDAGTGKPGQTVHNGDRAGAGVSGDAADSAGTGSAGTGTADD